MEEKKITTFPKGFFQKKRPAITTSEALKDVVPIEWEKVLENKKDNNKQIVKLGKSKTFD